tara:strand:+ start:569 stop:3433 length:2865 start_codon:yes stop_codon:yes gene_type:complete
MDLNRLIKKIEKYIGKDLRFSMREFKQLQLLREEVLKLEEILSHPSKDSSVLSEHYKEHALALQVYSEIIERRLDRWIKRLERLITHEEHNLTARDRQYLELWKNKINICKSNLIRILARGGELHDLINEEDPDWKQVEAKINEALGNNLHPGIRTLVVLFEQLEQAEEKLGKYSLLGISVVEYQKRIEQLKDFGFPVETELQLADFLVKHWDRTVEMTKAAGKFAGPLFRDGLPAVKYIINKKPWTLPGMIEMVKATGEESPSFFQYSLPEVKDIINEKTWPGMIEMTNATGEDFKNLFFTIYDLDTHYLINDQTWPGLIELVNASGNGASDLFERGLMLVVDLIKKGPWEDIKGRFLELIKYIKGTEQQLFIAFIGLRPLFDLFGIKLFDELIIPTAKSQTVGTFLCFQSLGKLAELNAIKTKQDLEILLYIVEKKSRKANDILRNIIIMGIEEGIIKDLSKEKEILKAFLEQTPAYLIELYVEFKNIYSGNLTDKHIHYENLFKDVKQLKEDIFNGVLTKDYNENIVLGVLYSVFSPEVSVDRDIYKRILASRTDRQSDIPSALNRLSGREVKISKGSFVLKEELDISSWNNLIEAVNEINRNIIKINPAETGMNLLIEHNDGTLRAKQKEYLKYIYSFDVANGNALPDFNTNHETLMKYKEFIGDRLKNDLIFTLLSKAQEAFPEQFASLLGKAKADYRRLAKTLSGLWNSNAKDKEARIKVILERNGFNVEAISWPADMTVEKINQWLGSLSTNVIEKSLIQKVFNSLYGEQYEGMQKEMEKFEFKREGKSLFGKSFTFILSKRKMHSVAMFNMGVCIAPDDKLWNSEDFWQMIIFDEENNACGGVIYRTIIESGKAYLIVSIQPSTSILSSVSPQQTYSRIIQFSRLIVKTLHYQNLLIPTDSVIHSNRGSIQSVISSNNYPQITLKHKYDFSYYPYHYQYNKFFIVA